jgi:ATP-binding cassette, subfamily B, bacterial PglK
MALIKVSAMTKAFHALRLLNPKEKLVFWLFVVARFLVNLMDIAGVGLLALAVNFLISDPGVTGSLTPVFELLRIEVDERGSKLPALFILGFVVSGIFVLKAVFSMLLIYGSTQQISNLEIRYSKLWMDLLTVTKGRFNAEALKEDIGYVSTAGAYAVFQRTLTPAGTMVSESAGLFVTVAVLAMLQPGITIGVLGYFGIIGYLLQRQVGLRTTRNADNYTSAHLNAVRMVREAIENEKALFLSGQRHHFVSRFAAYREVSSRSQANISILNTVPRYVVESALILGAFGLAGMAFAFQPPLEAATTLTFFLTAATRMTPTLLSLFSAVSMIVSAKTDVRLTEAMLLKADVKISRTIQ